MDSKLVLIIIVGICIAGYLYYQWKKNKTQPQKTAQSSAAAPPNDALNTFYRKNKKAITVGLIVILAIVMIFMYFRSQNQEESVSLPLSEAIAVSKNKTFESMTITNENLVEGTLELTVAEDAKATAKDINGEEVTLKSGDKVLVSTGGMTIAELKELGFVLPQTYENEAYSSGWLDLISRYFTTILLIGLLIWLLKGNILGSIGTKFDKGTSSVTFSDIGGMEGIKEDLKETVSFLNEKDHYKVVGATIPRGILLDGPPGTGKTLLAQAIANEAKVPFYYTSGSEFHNMFVGMAAYRVKRLFRQANKQPSVIFIDEFDSIAHRRGNTGTDAGREWNHTLNQLLSEMDGFKKNSQVIVIAATNRADVLDSAVTRAGRFDRRITVGLPDVAARIEILKIHSRGKPIAREVKYDTIARQTAGFSGADLALLVNEAAIKAGKEKSNAILMSHFSKAIDKVLVGDERKVKISDANRKVFAYHEAGHAIVSSFLPQGEKVERITILPHGSAGGFTRILQQDESLVLSKSKALSNISILLGGRVAEEMAIGDISSGAAEDLKRANELAREMVMHFGMGTKYALRYCGQNVYGMSDASTEATKLIEEDITDILQDSYQKSKEILQVNRKKLEALAVKLLDCNTLNAEEIEKILGE